MPCQRSRGGAILQRHPYEDLRVWQNAIGFLEMIFHETAEFPPDERHELGRRLRDAAIDWINDLSMAHSKSQDEFVGLLKSYHLYRTRLIILLKLGFRVGLIKANSYAELEGDLMEQEKVVAHQIDLLESGRGMHTGALTSRSAARSLQVADRDRRTSGGRGREDRDTGRGSREERPWGRDDREERFEREPRSGREAAAAPARSRSRVEEEPAAPASRSGRRMSSRDYDDAPAVAAEELAPTRSTGRRASTRATAEEPVEAPRTATRRASSRSAEPAAPAVPSRRASSRDEDYDDDAPPPSRSARSEESEATPVRRRRRAAVAEVVAPEAPVAAPSRTRRR